MVRQGQCQTEKERNQEYGKKKKWENSRVGEI